MYKDPVVTSGVKEYPVITIKASARFFKKNSGHQRLVRARLKSMRTKIQ